MVNVEEEKKTANLTAREIRELTGMKRCAFCAKYGIPLRTMENWEAGTTAAPQYVLELLERAVREDVGQTVRDR